MTTMRTLRVDLVGWQISKVVRLLMDDLNEVELQQRVDEELTPWVGVDLPVLVHRLTA